MITRNLSIERSESNTMWPTLIFGFRFTGNLPSKQLQSLWFIAAVTMMCTDHQTECVLQWLLTSVGIFALFLQTLCLLSSTEIRAFSFKVSVLRYTFKLSALQKAISSHCEVTHNKLNIITFGYISRYETWLSYSIWIFTAIYLFWCLVTALLILFVCH